MIINFKKLCNHSPRQSDNIVCLTSFIFEKEENLWRQKMYDKGFDFLYAVNLFDSNGDTYTVAKIQF